MQYKLEKHAEDTLLSHMYPIMASCRARTGALGLADGSESWEPQFPHSVMLCWKLFVQSRTNPEACPFFWVSTIILGCSVHTEVLRDVTNVLIKQ